MMPLAMLPAMPSASTICLRSSRSAAPTPAAAPIAPNTAVGWKPALCTAFGATRLSRHITSTPTAMPRSAASPSGLCRSQAASTAGTITAPACTGPPSKVSSKSSPCAAVPLTQRGARRAQACAHGRSRCRARRRRSPRASRCDIVLVARRDAQADHVDQQVVAFLAHRRRQLAIERRDALGQLLGDGDCREAARVMCCAAAAAAEARECG